MSAVEYEIDLAAELRTDTPGGTWAAVVGLMRPDGLALGATIGRSTAFNRACAIGCEGTRKARLGRPAEASIETAQSLARGTTMVSGPGQNASARCRAEGGISPSLAA